MSRVIALLVALKALICHCDPKCCVTTGMKRVSPSAGIYLRFTAHLCVAFLLTFSSLATAGIAAPKPATRESVRVVMDDNYPPYTFRDSSGTLQGILVDQWALWAKKTGTPVRLDAMDWAEAQQRMEAGDYDVIDTLFVNEHRKALYDFSAPYAKIDVPLFFSRELSGIRGPRDLAGFVVGAKKGDSSIEILKASGVVNFLFFDNYEAIVAAAREGRIKVFTIDKPPALYFLIRMGIQDQFRESRPLYSGEFHRAVRKGNSALLKDVQQGFNAISKGEYEGIEQRWYGAPILSKERLTWVAFIAGGAIVIVCLLMLWVWLLRRSVRQRTAELWKDITERQLTEESLRASAAQNRALIHAIPDLIFMHDRDGKYLAIHAPDPNLLILPSKTLLHQSLRAVLPEATAQHFLQAIRSALESGAMQELTYSLPLEGAEKHFEARVSPCTDDTVITLVRDVTEQINFEKTLANSEEAYRTSFEQAAIGIVHVSQKGLFLKVNACFLAFTGYSEGELLSKSYLDITHPEDQEESLAYVRGIQAGTGKPGTVQKRYLHRDGHVIWGETHVSVVRDPDGTFRYLLAMIQDITGRKQAEVALQKVSTAVEQSPAAIVITDTKGAIEYVNPRFVEMTGYTLAEVLGQNPRILKSGGHSRDFYKGLWDTIMAGEVWHGQFHNRKKNGELYWEQASISPIKDARGRITNLVAVKEDITERRKTEERLKESEEMFAKIYHLSPDAIDLTHLESGVQVEANQSYLRMFGYAREELLGHSTLPDDLGIWVNQEARDQHIARVKEHGEDCNFEALLRRKDGSIFVCLISSAWLAIGKGRYNLSICRDITERIKAENEICSLNRNLERRVKDRTAQLEAANQELETFSYSVSHDLRAPLRGIDGFSQALVEDYQDRLDETGRKYISRIRLGTQRMGQLIDDILKLSRVSRSELTPVKTDLSDLCGKIMGELTIAASGRRIEVSIQPDMSAWADPNLLQVAMENLLRNAWKFTSKREESRIEVGETPSPSGEPAFFIRDNGAGFDMAHADKLFDAFQRLHSTNEFDGTGIGLSIVQRIIHRHGGRIWAEAEPEKGATFFFTLPDRGNA